MDEKIRQALESAIAQKQFPGAVVGYIREGIQTVIPVGAQTFEQNSAGITAETIYDIASLTKVIPTSSLALSLIDTKRLSLTDSVRTYLTEFVHPEVTIWHLLTQTVSFVTPHGPLQLSALKDLPAEELLQRILQADLVVPPGTTYAYNNATSILLGLVITVVTGQPLDTAAEDTFFRPLAMAKTSFHPKDKAAVAPTEVDAWRGRTIQGEVHDESAYTLQRKWIVGSAGLFSAVPDLLRFSQMLLNKGEYEGKRYFSEAIITDMMTNQLAAIETYAGLGWELNQPRIMGKYSHDQMIGKTGFTGCVIMLDIPKERALVFLSNYTYPHRKATYEPLNALRRTLANIVFA